tara:strand:- start:1013 stop:1888 length:876 start_codon:yes stop_codon:yes gene_type:complete
LNKKIIILGIDGMIGHKIAQLLEQNNILFGTVRKKIIPKKLGLQNSKLIYKDFFENVSLDFLDELLPDIIINCIGITTRRINDNNINNLEFINSILPHKLNDWTERNQSKLIHFSSDCVFSGKKGNYLDESIPDATDLYGLSKSRGEVKSKNTLTIRCSIIGREIFNHTELFEWIYSMRGKQIKGYNNVLYSGVTSIWMGRVLKKILKYHTELSGIYNISSEPITKYSLLNLINEHFKLGIEISRDTKIKSNKVLISKKFTEITDINPPNWDDLMTEFKEDCIVNKSIYKI